MYLDSVLRKKFNTAVIYWSRYQIQFYMKNSVQYTYNNTTVQFLEFVIYSKNNYQRNKLNGYTECPINNKSSINLMVKLPKVRKLSLSIFHAILCTWDILRLFYETIHYVAVCIVYILNRVYRKYLKYHKFDLMHSLFLYFILEYESTILFQ